MTKITIENVRLCFPAIWEPKPFGEGEPAYQAVFPVKPGSSNHKALIKAINESASEKWPGNDPKTGQPKYKTILAKLRKEGRVAYIEEEYTNADGEVHDGFEGMNYIRARGSVQPAIKDVDGSDIQKSAGRPYPGCYVYAKIEIWAQDDKAYGRRVNCQFRGVQFFKDGEAFGGGRPASDDEFDDLSDLGEDDDDDIA